MVSEPTLQTLLERELGMPVSGPADQDGVRDNRHAAVPSKELQAALERLRNRVAGLQHAAARVGRIPENYPRHTNLIMRAVAALLPWYTRPIQEFSMEACGVATEIEAVTRLLSHQGHAARVPEGEISVS